MADWLIALLIGAFLAALEYIRRDGRSIVSVLPVALLRGLAATLVAALALDAPAGRARRPAPFVALDVSSSWLRGGDSAGWRAAHDSVAAARGDSVFLFGDSLRPAEGTAGPPADLASRVAPAVERALGVGRPLTVVTDGEIADPEALSGLPAGSRVVIVPRAAQVDAALSSIEAPRAIVDGDTIEVRVTVAAGGSATPAGSLALTLDGQVLTRTQTAPLTGHGERSIAIRAPVGAGRGGRVGPALLRASLSTAGDREARNDTL